jgi:hypothetical protein
MESVVLITTILVVILQCVILANQKKNAKKIDELATYRRNAAHSDRDRSRDRKDGSQRQQRRKKQDHRSKQQNTSSGNSLNAGENVEKSLRDINLKLKSVERDQDAARRKIQENSLGKESSKRRSGHGNRNDRRDHRRDRNNRNNNWRDRKGDTTASATDAKPSESAPKENAGALSAEEITPQTAAAQSLPDLNPVDFDTESTQHGRKFTVKRRILKDNAGNEASNENQEPENGGGESIENQNSETVNETGVSDNSEISFGRR